MKALVTGGTGFIGSHLVDRLLREGAAVRCLVRRSSERTWLAGKPIEFVEWDRPDDAEAIRQALRDVDVVFHGLGTLVAPNLEAFRKVNVEPGRLLLNACLERGGLARFVLLGSHGAAGPSRIPGVKTSEKDPCQPVSAYGQSKLEAEQETAQYRGKVPYTIVRLSAVYGPRDHNVLLFFQSAYRRGVIRQIGRQPKKVSLVHVQDAVEGIYQASISPKTLNETYFLASEEPCSFEDVRDALAGAMAKPVKLRIVPSLVVKAMMLYADLLSRVFRKDVLLNRDRVATLSYPHWVCDVSKARADFGYRQTVSLTEGFRTTFAWYRDNGWL